MSETGMTDAQTRSSGLAASVRLVGLAASIPEGDLLRAVGEVEPQED